MAERVLFYNAMIKPLFMYCNVVWSNCSQDNIMKLFKLQKRAARIILNLKPRHLSIDAFNQLNWIPFYVEIDLRRCMLAHKRINGVAPEYLKKMLVLNNEIHSRSTRGAGLLFRTPNYYRQTESGKRFSTYACKLWNSLPLNIR